MDDTLPPLPRYGAVIINGAVVCCAEQDREPCPHQPERRCSTCPGNARAAIAAAQQGVDEVEQEIIARYTVEKRSGGGFWPYCVRATGGTMELFIGHKNACENVRAALQTACLDGAFMMRTAVAAESEAGKRAAIAAAQQWRPIETAPKDGRTVIVGRDMGDFGFVRGVGYFAGVPGAFCSGWISRGFTDPPGNLGLAHPTHWMPLPLPPGEQPAAAQAEQAAQQRAWRDIKTAPLDGTLVQLLVKFDNHGIEDTDEPTATIGSHNDGEWNFAGWEWHRDEWTRGSGDLLGRLPMGPTDAAAQAEQARPDAGNPLLQRLIDSIDVLQGKAVWDYSAMYDVRDALAQAAAAQAEQAAQHWVPAHERVPEPGTECVVIVRYTMNGPRFATVDTWDIQREDPTGMGGPTIETGQGWNDNNEADVIAWMPIPKHPPEDWDQRIDAALAPQQEPKP